MNSWQTDVKAKLSTLWIVVRLNMVFAYIYSIMVVLAEQTTPDIPGDVMKIMIAEVIIIMAWRWSVTSDSPSQQPA